MSKPGGERVPLAGMIVDLMRGELLAADGRFVALRPRSFAVLRLLLEDRGQMVSKDTLMTGVWPDVAVTDDSLTQCIADIRRAIGDKERRVLRTVPRRGYVLDDTVTPALRVETTEPTIASPAVSFVHGFGVHPHPAAPGKAPAWPPVTKYARSGDVHIAYQVTGDGPVDLVFVQGYVTHLEIEWEDPRPAALYQRLASFCRLIRFDKRGTGLSDRVHGIPTLEERMDDVRAVMDAAGSERAILLGSSEGGPMSMLFCATYPQRVQSLILYGAMARFAWAPDNPWGRTDEQQMAHLRVLEEKWGQGHSVDWFAPSIAALPEYRAWRARLDRAAASPGAAKTLSRMNFGIDVRHILPAIRTPTLVLHRTEEQVVNIAHSRYLASHIPQAKFVELPGRDHAPWVGETEAFCRAIEAFSRQAQPPPVDDRILTTILCVIWTDLDATAAGSPAAATQVLTRQMVAQHRGRIVETMREGILAAFDGPARAVRAGQAVVNALSGRAIPARAGIHTGECDMRGDTIEGDPLRIAAHVAAHARPGEVLASAMVCDIIAGSGLRFTPRSECMTDILTTPLRLLALEAA